MHRTVLAQKVRDGVRKIEAAYKVEIKIAGQGHSAKSDHDRAEKLYFEGNNLIREVLEALDPGQGVDKLPGKIGGNIR